MAQRSYPTAEVWGGGREELPQPEVCGGGQEEQPPSKEQWLHGCRRAERSYLMFKVSRGDYEEIPLIQGKKERLHFSGTAVKIYPTSKARETPVRGHQRADTLKP